MGVVVHFKTNIVILGLVVTINPVTSEKAFLLNKKSPCLYFLSLEYTVEFLSTLYVTHILIHKGLHIRT